MRVARGSCKRPPCIAPQKLASSLKYVQPHSRRIVRKTISRCFCASGWEPSSAYQGPRRQPPKVTLSERKGLPSASLMNQSGCCSNRCDFSSAMNGATQVASFKPPSRISFHPPCILPPKAPPLSRQSPLGGL